MPRWAGRLAILWCCTAATARASADSPWLYGIHWYGDHNVTEVEQMTGGKGIWVLEIILTEDSGTWSLAQQMPKFQAIVARGHTLIIRIQPRWSLVVPGDETASNPGDRMSTFLPKVTQAAQQLAGLCHIWQIGNEMNLGFEYDIGNLTPSLYVQKFKQIRNAIKSVPSSLGPQIVMLGPVAPVDNAYLGGMLDNLTASDIDAFGLHAYGGSRGDLRGMYRTQLQYIDSRGYQNKPVYMVEWGAPVDPISDTNEAGTALFLRNELQELANWNAGAGNHDIVCAIWFVYAWDSFWKNWSIRYLHNLHPRGANTDLWDSLQLACTLNLPAGAGGGSTPGNTPPTAVAAGNPLSGSAPLIVNFSAAGSSDPDPGQTLSYSWSFGDNTTGSGLTTSHTYTNEGAYVVVLTVSDGHGGSGVATVHVTVGSGGTPIAAISNPDFQANGAPFTVATAWTSFGGNKWESAFDAQRSWVQGVSDLPANNGSAGVRQTFATTPGRQYRLGVFSKVTHADLDTAIGVSATGGTSAASATFGAPGSPTTYAEVFVTFTAEAATATVFLRGRNPRPFAVVGGWVFFDGVTLMDVTPTVTVNSDFDGDGDVDLSDFGFLQRCLSPAGGQFPPAGCDAARLDEDIDVDGQDVALFLACFSGSNVPADQECDDPAP